MLRHALRVCSTFLLLFILFSCNEYDKKDDIEMIDISKEWFYVKHAVLESLKQHLVFREILFTGQKLPHDPQYISMTYSGHRIQPGRGTVFAFRRFFRAKNHKEERHAYGSTKLTIYLSETVFQENTEYIEIPVGKFPSDVVAFISHGTQGSYLFGSCIGYARWGKVILRRNKTGAVNINISLRFRTGNSCGPWSHWELSATVYEKELNSLNPWDGKVVVNVERCIEKQERNLGRKLSIGELAYISCLTLCEERYPSALGWCRP